MVGLWIMFAAVAIFWTCTLIQFFMEEMERKEDINKRIDFQNKLLVWILGAILITVVALYGGLIIYLIGKLS